ncbi:MAG TPA: phosphotransferase [Chloroflexota bacterium]|nr:phosphotransferase [Chloroflexota bacterium]
MRGIPEDLPTEAVSDSLSRHWSVKADRLKYLPKGWGAYHWVAFTGDEPRWFVTCDDLDTKPWLGSDREAVFEGVKSAYQAAVRLRQRAGLDFVIAPLRTQSAETAVRIIARYSLALFPFVEGEPGRWGEQLSAPECRALVTLLADLHAGHWATCAVPRRDMEIPGRRRLEEALGETNRHWHGGPFSEPTRQEVAKSRGVVLGGLDTFDALAAQLSGSPFAPVVTHGEPHAGNLIRRDDGFALVDWDTVALDRPERDSWMVDDGSGAAWATYEELTGRAVDRDAVRLYRLLWELSDVAAFTAQLRARHTENPDTRKAWISLRRTLTALDTFT